MNLMKVFPPSAQIVKDHKRNKLKLAASPIESGKFFIKRDMRNGAFYNSVK